MTAARVQGSPGGWAASKTTKLRLKACAILLGLPALLAATGHTSLRVGLPLLVVVAIEAIAARRAQQMWRSSARRVTGTIAERDVVAHLQDLDVTVLVSLHLKGWADIDLVVITRTGSVAVLEVKAGGPAKISVNSDTIFVGSSGKTLAATTIQQCGANRDLVARTLQAAGLGDVTVKGAVVVGAPRPRRADSVAVGGKGQILTHHSGLGICDPAGLRQVLLELGAGQPDVDTARTVRKALQARDGRLAIRP